MYDNWISGIYNITDGMFKYWESQDETVWLRKIIRENLGEDYLYDENEISKFVPKDEYEGIKRSQTTEGKKGIK